MPIEPSIQITVKGSSEALKTLQGIKREVSSTARDMKKAAQEQEKAQAAATKAAEKAARAQQKDAQQTARVQEKAARDAARAAEKAQRDIERAADREAKRWQDLANKSLAARVRAMNEATKAAEREAAKQVKLAEKTAKAEAKARRDTRNQFMAATTAGVVAGALKAGSTGRAIVGAQDLQSRIHTANNVRERLVRVGTAAGLTPEQVNAAQSRMLATSTKTGVTADQLTSVLEVGQSQFSDVQFFLDNIEEIAKVSQVAGADAGEFAKSLGFIKQAFGLTGKEAVEAAYLMKAAAEKGSIEVKDFATDFAPVAGIFAEKTGVKGMEGVRQFFGVAQAGGTLGAGSAQTATMTERFVALLGDVDKMKELRTKAGIDVRGKTPEQIIDEMASSSKLAKPGMMNDIFGHDILGTNMITALISARRRVQEGKGDVDIGSIARADIAAGRTGVDKGMQAFSKESWFQNQVQIAQEQAKVFDNLDQFNKDALLAAKAANTLEEKLGRLAPWVDTLTNSIAVGAGVNFGATLLKGAAGGGGTAAAEAAGGAGAASLLARAAGGVGSLLAAGGTAVGAASAGVVAGTIGAGLAVGGTLGYGLNKGATLLNDEGKDLSDFMAEYLWDIFQGAEPQTTTERGLGSGGQVTSELVQVMKQNTRVLEAIERKTGAGGPGTGVAAREPS